MRRDFGKLWQNHHDEWTAALAAGDALRHQERFAKEAADAARRREGSRDRRPDRERWEWEFARAVEQREQRKTQATDWAQQRKAAARAA